MQLRSAGQRRDRGGARGRVVLVPTDFMANSCSPATPLPTLPMMRGQGPRMQADLMFTSSLQERGFGRIMAMQVACLVQPG
ncbi:hypothetical protein J4Q44_G00167910 [Coregonus suidteri]|uniref:Uncharacterized protein n=1 Tax=Coregonus suidteri TaxID=861788 RepID=A0AAN8QRF0_9TELE